MDFGLLASRTNEMDDVPFFNSQLPYEVAINIFQYLDRKELGRCAQVSKTWKVIAEDEVLWYRLCQQEGHLPESNISDYSCWKLIFQECQAKEHILRTNWKNRKGAVSELEHIPDEALCGAHSHDGLVIAGYTSGDVRVWDTRTWDYIAPFLESEEDGPGVRPHVSFVRINSSLAVAAYQNGPHLRHMDVPGLGVESELWPLGCTATIATPDPGHVCCLHHSSRQRRVLDPMGGAGDRAHNLVVCSRIRFRCTTTGTPETFYF